nr:MAG TPA: hypothetical protein [Caudoviricetes sp.]
MLTFTILCAIMCLSVVGQSNNHLYNTSNKLQNKTKTTFINYCV